MKMDWHFLTSESPGLRVLLSLMKRRSFLRNLGLTGLGLTLMNDLKSLTAAASAWKNAEAIMPALFIGHGAPTYALGDNEYARAWRTLGDDLPTPNAILSVSAHWLTPGKTLVTASQNPHTIHDFGGFQKELYEIQYPAPGMPELAEEISNEVRAVSIGLDHEWGLDHGTWCVLHHMFPEATIPVLQLSIDYSKGPEYHFELARHLRFLRQKGVLIIGSGNIVHNLRVIKFPESTKYDWAIEFDQQAKELMDKSDFRSLIDYHKLGQAAQLSIPTPDHYYPLMYTLGLKMEREELTYPVDGIAFGSTSMRSVMIR